MASQPSRTNPTSNPMGNSIPCLVSGEIRSPALDSYFATSANLGTHTCFMIMLPILFWCGYTSLGRG